jgi:signal transduction histidine kinase
VNAEVRTQAQAQADLLAATAADLLAPRYRRALQTMAQKGAASVRGRILVVDATGAVLVDTGSPPQIGVNYESRPEIEAALAGHQVQGERYSQTLHQQILATAVPIIRHGRPVGAVRVTQSVAAVHGAVKSVELRLALIGLLVLLLGLFAGGLIAAQIARPIKRLEQVARRVAHGDLSARATVDGSREQRSLARSFNEMTGRISRLVRAHRDFVADASHQLRTPLTGLRLRLEEAKAIGSSPAAEVELDAAIEEVDRLSHTVEELLVLSRAGERRLAASTVELDELARSAVYRWQQTADGAGIALVLEGKRQGGTAWAAREDLERALDTLLDNALRYSPAGTTVTVRAQHNSIEVRDQGPGLSADEPEVIFERFRRGRAGRSGPPGSGLGLAIARELTREWGGEVTIANRDPAGAVATITMPLQPAPQPRTEEQFAPA